MPRLASGCEELPKAVVQPQHQLVTSQWGRELAMPAAGRLAAPGGATH